MSDDTDRCAECGHKHQGERFAYICIGCPCPATPGREPEETPVTADRSAAADTLRDEIRDVLAEEEAIAELAGLMTGVMGREDCARLVFAWHQAKQRRFADAQVAAARERIAATCEAQRVEHLMAPGDAYYNEGLELAARIARGQP